MQKILWVLVVVVLAGAVWWIAGVERCPEQVEITKPLPLKL
jgi:hypothetical protein